MSLEDFKFPISKYVLSLVLTANLLLPKTSNEYTLSAVEPIHNEVSTKILLDFISPNTSNLLVGVFVPIPTKLTSK